MLRHNISHMMIHGGSPKEIGMGDLLKRFAEAARKEDASDNPEMDAAMTQKQQQAEKFLKRKVPGMVTLAKVAPETLRADRNALTQSLIDRLYQSPPSPALKKSIDEFLHDTDRNLPEKQVADLLYLLMTRPEYQLT
ncbi:MAG: DUF1800 domain-containing protein [Blastochloris sp.]|nr:DUF1800 domain-containing protein [Blastochloris sp.]